MNKNKVFFKSFKTQTRKISIPLDIFKTSEEINLRPSVEYFSHAAPRAFRYKNFFAANACGDILFGFRNTFWFHQDNETGFLTLRKTRVEIAKYQVKSGDNCVFSLDPNLAAEDLCRMISFYVLNDFLGVIVTYNQIDYNFKQHLVIFDHKQKVVRRIYERKLKLNDLFSDAKVGLGEIGRGRILVYGSREQRNGEPEVIAHSLSADPRPSSVVQYPDINLTAQIANFVLLLKSDLPNCGIFPTGLFVKDNHMYFLIKNQENSDMVLHTIGRMRICENDEKSKKASKDCYKLLTATGHLRYGDFIRYFELIHSVHRGRSVWLSFLVPDFKQIFTFSFLLHGITLGLTKKLIELSISFGRRMRRLDGGWTLRMVQKFFQWIYGLSMSPVMTFPMIYEIYNLDLETLVYKKVNYEPKFGKSGATNYPRPILMDSDIRGGLLLWEAPTKTKQQLNIRYFSPPHQPETLARLAENMIYRKHSSFARDETIRRGLGVCDYNWKL